MQPGMAATILNMKRLGREHRYTVWKTILYMLGMAVACGWVAALAYPVAIKLHVPPTVASRLPNYAFVVGLALGLGIGLSRSMKEIFTAVLAMAILGGMFWLTGLFIEGLLIGFGLPPEFVSWVSPTGCVLGI